MSRVVRRVRSVFAPTFFLAWLGCAEGEPSPPVPPATEAVERAVPAPPPAVEGHGDVTGRVVLRGAPPALPALDATSDPACPDAQPAPYVRVDASGGLRDVVVRLPDGVASGRPTAFTVVLDQQACRYEPYVLGAQVGQTLEVRNSDPTLHNVNARHGERAVFNRPQPEGAQPLMLTFTEPGAMTLRCDVHPWMLAHVRVGDHPHFAVSGADGSFALRDVPAGTYALEAWHPHLAAATLSVTVEPDATREVVIELDAASYEAPRR